MRVGLDVTAMISGATGVARYADRLLAELRSRDDVDVHPFAIGRPQHPLPGGVRHLPVPLRVVHASWRAVRFPTDRMVAGPVDLVHTVDMVPAPGRTPSVLTIHDVLPLVMPEQYGERYVRIARHQAAAAPHVDAIVTTCEATAAAIVDVLGVERARIAVAPIGHRESAADRRPSPPGPYLLAVGALTPRKGFVDLATAVGRLAPGHPPLLIAGPDGWKADEVRAAIAALGLGDRVQLLGPVSDQELDALYRGALVACHPSHAEGFGMPALEAMHFAVPLVAADIPPVREICAGTQVLVPPGDVDGLAGALDRLLADPAARQELASAGRRRAEAFSWVAMADAVVDVYRRVT